MIAWLILDFLIIHWLGNDAIWQILFVYSYYGFSWSATGIDQVIPEEITLRKSDFEEDISWQNFDEPALLSIEDLAFDVLLAGHDLTR